MLDQDLDLSCVNYMLDSLWQKKQQMEGVCLAAIVLERRMGGVYYTVRLFTEKKHVACL